METRTGTKEKFLKALCMSRSCSTVNRDISRTVKNVPSTARECPDCGSMLVWKKLTEEQVALYSRAKQDVRENRLG